ncbi:MAG: hypothetical protein WC657_06120 [Candidatus Paceibacterota bacterium]|jgi:hypothetical protein
MSPPAMLRTKNMRETLSPVSSRALEAERTETLAVLDGFLKRLGYLK